MYYDWTIFIIIPAMLLAMLGLGLLTFLTFAIPGFALPFTLLSVAYTAISALIILLVQRIRRL